MEYICISLFLDVDVNEKNHFMNGNIAKNICQSFHDISMTYTYAF